jgi:tRNA(Ile)-lysidine synthase TilS/MesJ
VKPFKYTYEKEIVMYAYYKKLDFFSTECIYAPHAARGLAREYVKDLELIRPAAIIDLIKSAEEYRYPEGVQLLLSAQDLQLSCLLQCTQCYVVWVLRVGTVLCGG